MNLFRLKSKKKDNTDYSIDNNTAVEDKKRDKNKTTKDLSEAVSEDGTKNSLGDVNYQEHDNDNGDNFDAASGAERTEDNDEESTQRVESVSIEANISPGANEKNTLLSILFELRKDGTFCDVAFLCHGTLFTAHRCVVRKKNLRYLVWWKKYIELNNMSCK